MQRNDETQQTRFTRTLFQQAPTTPTPPTGPSPMNGAIAQANARRIERTEGQGLYGQANADLASLSRAAREQAFPNTITAFRGASQNIGEAYQTGGIPAAIGATVRNTMVPAIGLADDLGSSFKRALDPAANALKAAATGDYSPIDQPAVSTLRRTGPDQAQPARPGAGQALQGFSAASLTPEQRDAAGDAYRGAWQQQAPGGLRNAGQSALDLYNAEQQVRGTNISAQRQANGTMAFSGSAPAFAAPAASRSVLDAPAAPGGEPAFQRSVLAARGEASIGAGGMRGGTVNTIPAAAFASAGPAASRAVSAALNAAAERGDWRDVQDYYQQGGGTWLGATAAESGPRPRGGVIGDGDAARREFDTLMREASTPLPGARDRQLTASQRTTRENLLQSQMNAKIAGLGQQAETERAGMREQAANERTAASNALAAQQNEILRRRTENEIGAQTQATHDRMRVRALQEQLITEQDPAVREQLSRHLQVIQGGGDRQVVYAEQPIDPANPMAGVRRTPMMLNPDGSASEIRSSNAPHQTPSALEGMRYVGTSNGNPVFQDQNGRRFIQEAK